MSSFITPILAKFSAELEVAVETATANILAELQGVTRMGTRAPTAAAKPARNPSAARAKGAKRSPDELEALVETVFALIKRHGGLLTKDMALPIKKLRAAKRITVSGEKRATTYSVRGGK